MRLHRPELSEAENLALYGACSRTHGHNFDVEVAVAGTLDPTTGMVVNFYEIEQIIRQEIFERVDHKYLNTDLPELQGIVPTTENLAARFWEWIEGRLRGCKLFSVSVGERDTNIVVYYGPKATLEGIRGSIQTQPAAVVSKG